MTARWSDRPRPGIDPERTKPHNPFDHEEGVSGQSYSREREAAWAADDPSGAVAARAPDGGSEGRTPPEAGRRAAIDPATGEARGSGSGAGDSPAGEDYDSDPQGGDGAAAFGGATKPDGAASGT